MPLEGKNSNKQNILCLSFKCLYKTAVNWVNRIVTMLGRSSGNLLLAFMLDECHYYSFCSNIQKSKFMALGIFSLAVWLP